MIKRISRSLATGAATLALGLAFAGPVASQGVPTVDTQNIAQEIRQLQQMLQDFGIQTDLLDNALAQLDLLKQQFDQLEETPVPLQPPAPPAVPASASPLSRASRSFADRAAVRLHPGMGNSPPDPREAPSTPGLRST